MVEPIRATVRQACDYCRLRKIRCQPIDEDGTTTTLCKQCSAGKLDCTYDMPVKRRGPPPKKRRIVTELPNTDDDHDHSTPGATAITAGGSIRQGSLHIQSPLSVVSAKFDGVATIQRVCSQVVFDAIMQDYLQVIYPLVPVVHRPTFLEDLRNERYLQDRTFQSFCFAICALVMGILPHKFDEYKLIDGSLLYPTRRDAVNYIHALILQTRPMDYFDNPDREKWAIAYMISTTVGHLGHTTRAKIYHAETSVMSAHIGLNQISSYAGLDQIEIQLRKKAFWLTFTTYSHLRKSEVHWDSLEDRLIFETADAELLMPLDIDDEYITAEVVLPQPPGNPSVVIGFNALTLINNCLVTIIKDPALPLFTCREIVLNPKSDLGVCDCGRHIQPASLSSLIQAKLRKIQHVLDDLPAELGTWSRPSSISESTLVSQYESMKANIHVTHLWVQSLLLERLISATGGAATENHPDKERIWEMRESICQQLLQLLNNISQSNLEPNGYFLITKTREVAAGLLDCPFEEQDNVSLRAKTYIQSFADILAQLDNAYQHDYQQRLWEELDEQTRVSPSTFQMT